MRRAVRIVFSVRAGSGIALVFLIGSPVNHVKSMRARSQKASDAIGLAPKAQRALEPSVRWQLSTGAQRAPGFPSRVSARGGHPTAHQSTTQAGALGAEFYGVRQFDEFDE